jgi:glycosyltransferase involved in cell wall biosynthesis
MSLKLSVVLTTYRRAELLDRTFASLAAQTRLPDEIVVSDDCSPDDTPRVVERWRGRFPRFVSRRNEKNLNMPGNLNAAIAASSGAYVANLHDGDTYDPSLLEKWERALDEHPTAGLVFCGLGGWPVETKHGNGVLLYDIAPLTPGRTFFERHLLHQVDCPIWGTVMARRSAYDRLLPFDARFGFVSDVDMWMRICLDDDVAYVKEPLIHLDHSPSDQRTPGTYNWQWLEWARQIHLANIDRFFADDAARRRRELRVHNRMFQRFWAARLLGRLRRRDFAGLRKGLAGARALPPPLGLVGRSFG